MNLELLLKEHNLKVTPQRLGILEVMQSAGHISIDELYLHVKKEFRSISLATLYKNIHAMIERALIKEVKVPTQKVKYEIIKAPHAHLYCKICHSVEDIAIKSDSLTECVDMTQHFTIEESEVVFSGICEACQANTIAS